ncbi:MAG: glycosyltransferase, partial [Patescibacteria group bacterium]
MNVVMLSQDMKILEGGPTAARIASYGTIFRHLTVVVFGVGARHERALAPNVRAVAPGGRGKTDAFFLAFRETEAVLAREHPDVISAQDPFFIGFAGLIAAKRAHIPLQIQIHTDPFAPAFAFASVRRLIESVLARLVIPRAACVRAVSERTLKSVRRMTSAPVSVLPIPPSTVPGAHLAEARAASENFSVLSVSRLTDEKRLHVLIDAMRDLPRATLTVVGDGPLREALEARARASGVHERVRFAGWQDDASPFYASADAFVSLSAYEGYGRSLIEASLSALPIVTTDVGIGGEVLRDGKEALVVRPRSRDVARAL